MKRLRFEPEASEELLHAIEGYGTALGTRLLARGDRSLEMVQRMPETWPTVPRVRVFGRSVRKKLIGGFPYAIIFVELDDEVRVLAFAHGRRRPYYWRKRPT